MNTPRLRYPERITGALWGLIIAAVAGLALAALSGLAIDLEVFAIGALVVLGGWLLISALLAAVKR